MEVGDNIQGDGYSKKTGHIGDATDTEFFSTTKENLIDLSDGDDKNHDATDDEVFKYIETKVEERTKLGLENEKLKAEISSMRDSIQFYKNNYITYDEYKNLQDELESQKRHYEKIIKLKKNDYELKVQALNQKLSESNKELQNYKNYNESFKTEFQKIQEELDEKNRDISFLKTNNTALKEEASKYQSALGVAVNFRTSDNKNHSVQLKNDILSLQDAIEHYVTNLKGKIEVNVENVKNLVQDYKCLTNITMEKTENQNKAFIKAVLQRYVLDIIIENANNYFNRPRSLESEIYMQSNNLCSKLDEFSKTRKGTDTITSTSSIKVRQEICVALSNRGFSEIIEDNQTTEHNFIKYLKHILNESMNECRTINDPAKKQSVENMATNIICEFIKIFWFRLFVQEPIIKIAWFEPNTKIDQKTMTGRWEKGDDDVDIDNSVVDLCYFPIIGLNLDDQSKLKLYTRAKVFPRQERSYASSLYERMKNAITKESSTGHDSCDQNRGQT